MAISPFPPLSRILAATSDGPVDKALPPQGVAVQAPDPGSILKIVAVVGDRGTSSVGNNGIAVAGDYGEALIGPYGVAVVGEGGMARGGAQGICVAINGGVAHTGDGGIAFTRSKGESIVEAWGVSIALEGGVVSAGQDSAILIGYPVGDGRFKLKVGIIGTGGLLPGVRYALDGQHNFIPV